MTTPTVTRLDKLGRIVIPADMRKELGLKPGDKLRVVEEDGVIHLTTTRGVLLKIQEEMARYRPEGGVLRSEELVRERKEEAERE